MRQYVALSVAALLVFSACSAHNPMNIKNVYDVQRNPDANYPAHTNKILVTPSALPASIETETVAQIEIGKVWYGSTNDILAAMAKIAREIGADAVINVRTWYQPSGWSWSAPQGSGTAVKVSDPAALKQEGVAGDWY